jgi:hypothetical protein
VDVVVTPPIGSAEQRALLLALERAGVHGADAAVDRVWRRAGLREAVEDDDQDSSYAFSPRRTRGATRA